MEKIIFFKVYQDMENAGPGHRYFVEEAHLIKDIIDSYYSDAAVYDDIAECGPPIFEPVMMTIEEFKKLPEFDGY